MQLLMISLNHANAPLTLCEQSVFAAERITDALANLRRHQPGLVAEYAILPAGNRTELYCAVAEAESAHRALVGWLAGGHAALGKELGSHLHTLSNRDAVRHAFRVASGCDPLAPDARPISGLMKSALRHAEEAGSLGTYLRQMFQCAFAVERDVSGLSEIGPDQVSLAAATVRLALRFFPDPRQARVLFVGAGEMIALAATLFAAQHPLSFAVASHTRAQAEPLARRIAARTLRLAELPAQLAQFDIVVSCANSSRPIFHRTMVKHAIRARAGRPIFMADLALPGDVEPAVEPLAGVSLFTVADLGSIAQSDAVPRRLTVTQGEAVIETRVDAFMNWLDERRTMSLLRALDKRAERMRLAEIERARQLLAQGKPADAVLAALATGIENQFLHGPRALLMQGTLTPSEARGLVEQCLPARLGRSAETKRYPYSALAKAA